MLWIALVLVALLGAPGTLSAQDLTGRQREILLTAISSEGWLTEEMHLEFWAAMPADTRSDPRMVEAFVATIDRVSVSAIRFQREAWTSMKLSLRDRRVVKTAGYERAKAAMMASSLLPSYSEQAEVGATNAEEMIQAAASGQPFASARGTFYITEELVDRVLAGLEGSLHRFRRLANPVWAMDVDEWRYPDEHVRILWDAPFNREAIEINLEGDRRATVRMLQSRLSEQEFVQLGFIHFDGRWLNPGATARRVARAALKRIGIEDTKPIATHWRRRISAEASGSVSTSEGNIHAAVRVVPAPEHRGAWTFMGLTLTSRAEATLLRGLLEQATQLD